MKQLKLKKNEQLYVTFMYSYNNIVSLVLENLMSLAQSKGLSSCVSRLCGLISPCSESLVHCKHLICYHKQHCGLLFTIDTFVERFWGLVQHHYYKAFYDTKKSESR